MASTEEDTCPGFQAQKRKAEDVNVNWQLFGPIAFKSSDKGESRMLSNFYQSPINYLGRHFPTAEHLYQWLKVDCISDGPTREKQQTKILDAKTAHSAKIMGSKKHTCPLYRKDVMENIEKKKEEIMSKVLHLKFEQNPECQRYLLSTYPRTIYERKGPRDGNSDWVGLRGLMQILLTKERDRHFVDSEETDTELESERVK